MVPFAGFYAGISQHKIVFKRLNHFSLRMGDTSTNSQK